VTAIGIHIGMVEVPRPVASGPARRLITHGREASMPVKVDQPAVIPDAEQ
jgi:hypothetical protein